MGSDHLYLGRGNPWLRISEGKIFFCAEVSVAVCHSWAWLTAVCKGSWQEPALGGQAGLAELRGISILLCAFSHSQM